jgi:hypothetical protein
MGSLAAWGPAVVVVLLFHIVWEGHGVVDPAFRNPDVAGIAYNARVLANGGLPYVDTAEIKPPGAFLLFAPFLDLGGMRAVWGVAMLWGASLSLATGALAAACFGLRAGPRAAMLHAAWAVLATDGDINYSFWMSLPFTLAAACACAAVTSCGALRRRVAWTLAGALSLFAVSIKPSAWTLLAVFALLGVRELVRGRASSALEGALGGLAGALLAAGLIALPYAARGELPALARGLANVSAFGNEYVSVVKNGYGGRFPAALAGFPCLVEQLPGPIAFALAGSAGLFGRGERGPLALGAFAFALAAFVGVAYTLRFFTHDDAQLLPALAVLAVRPMGLVSALLDRLRSVPRIAMLAPAVLGIAAAYPDYRQRKDYVHFMGERDHMIADICKKVGPLLPDGEPVLAWGWHAWSVYEHCQRRAPGRVFKVLAHVTTLNTNTCNNGFGPIALRRGPELARFFDEVRRRPPGLFLWSNYFDEMGADPLRDFGELNELVQNRYSIVDVRGPFVAMLRTDLMVPERLANAAADARQIPGRLESRECLRRSADATSR